MKVVSMADEQERYERLLGKAAAQCFKDSPLGVPQQETQKRGEIGEQIEMLDTRIGMLDSAITHVAERIAPVCCDGPESGSLNAAAGAASALGNRLAYANERLTALHARLCELADSVRL